MVRHSSFPIYCWLMLTSYVFSVDSHATKVSPKGVQAYKSLIEIVHLNNETNRQQLANILMDIEQPHYDGIRAAVLGKIAKLETNHGNWPQAKRLLARAIEHVDNTIEDNHKIDALNHISWVYFNRGNYAQAIYYVKKMADFAYECGSSLGQAIALNRLALSYIELGFTPLAYTPLTKAMKIARDNGHDNAQLLSLMYLANAHVETKTTKENDTLGLIEQANLLGVKLGYGEGYIARLKGLVYLNMNQKELAHRWLLNAYTIAEQENDMRLMRLMNQALAEFHLNNQELERAYGYANVSLKIANELQHHASAAKLHYLLSQIQSLQGQHQQAFKYLNLYIQFLSSDSSKNAIILLNLMDKRIDNLIQKNKLIELDNKALDKALAVQKDKISQHQTMAILIAIIVLFMLLTVGFLIRHRMMSLKVMLSMRDSLTGAYGRSYLTHYLAGVQARLLRDSHAIESFGVILIDCDDFKNINDKYGHDGGDQALKHIVQAINMQSRSNDQVFRWGGDEFVLFCEQVSKATLEDIANRLVKSISQLEIPYDRDTIAPSISIGMALYDKKEPFNIEHLLKTADAFLYQSKRSGKNMCRG